MWWSLKNAEGETLNRGNISSAHYIPPPQNSDGKWGGVAFRWSSYPKADIVYTSSDIGCFSSEWLYLCAAYCDRIWGSVSRLTKDHPNAYLTISFEGGNNYKYVKLSDFQSAAKSFKLLHLREKLIGHHASIGVGSSLAAGSLIGIIVVAVMGVKSDIIMAASLGVMVTLVATMLIITALCGGYSKNLKAADALKKESKNGDWTLFTMKNIENQFLAEAPKATIDQ